jgi:hypothetical protein
VSLLLKLLVLALVGVALLNGVRSLSGSSLLFITAASKTTCFLGFTPLPRLFVVTGREIFKPEVAAFASFTRLLVVLVFFSGGGLISGSGGNFNVVGGLGENGGWCDGRFRSSNDAFRVHIIDFIGWFKILGSSVFRRDRDLSFSPMGSSIRTFCLSFLTDLSSTDFGSGFLTEIIWFL